MMSQGNRRIYRGKRVVDVIGALLAIFFLFPFTLLGILLVWVLDGRPIFFHQERIGRGKKRLRITKIRTMSPGSHQKHLAQLSKPARPTDDFFLSAAERPKATSVGRLLRKFSIDEIPQLLQVLSGEMSLVGPRPLLLEELKFVDQQFYSRFKVNPGVTGLWQISGRKSTSSTTALELDVKYVEQQSLLMDIAIIIRTPTAMLRGA